MRSRQWPEALSTPLSKTEGQRRERSKKLITLGFDPSTSTVTTVKMAIFRLIYATDGSLDFLFNYALKSWKDLFCDS